MEKFKKSFIYQAFPKSIYMIFLARIINSMGGFVYPFLTLFLTKNLHLGEDVAGIFMMVAAVSSVPGALLGGKLTDHWSRKKVMIISQALAAVCFIPCAYLGNSIIVPILLILSAFFTGAAQPAYNALTTDLTNMENRKKIFSFLYLGNNIGLAIGTLLAGFLFNHHIRWIFLGDAASTFISLLFIGAFVKETLPLVTSHKETDLLHTSEKAEKGSLWRVLLTRPVLLVFSLISAVYSFIYAQVAFAIPLHMNEIFGMAGPKIYGTVMAVNAGGIILFTTMITHFTEKITPILNIVAAGVFFCIGFGMLYFISGYLFILISTVIWTIGEILNTTNVGVYTASRTPISHRGRFNAIIPLITGAGFAIGPFIMGYFIRTFGIRIAWPIIAGLSLVSAVGMLAVYFVENRKRKTI